MRRHSILFVALALSGCHPFENVDKYQLPEVEADGRDVHDVDLDVAEPDWNEPELDALEWVDGGEADGLDDVDLELDLVDADSDGGDAVDAEAGDGVGDSDGDGFDPDAVELCPDPVPLFIQPPTWLILGAEVPVQLNLGELEVVNLSWRVSDGNGDVDLLTFGEPLDGVVLVGTAASAAGESSRSLVVELTVFTEGGCVVRDSFELDFISPSTVQVVPCQSLQVAIDDLGADDVGVFHVSGSCALSETLDIVEKHVVIIGGYDDFGVHDPDGITPLGVDIRLECAAEPPCVIEQLGSRGLSVLGDAELAKLLLEPIESKALVFLGGASVVNDVEIVHTGAPIEEAVFIESGELDATGLSIMGAFGAGILMQGEKLELTDALITLNSSQSRVSAVRASAGEVRVRGGAFTITASLGDGYGFECDGASLYVQPVVGGNNPIVTAMGNNNARGVHLSEGTLQLVHTNLTIGGGNESIGVEALSPTSVQLVHGNIRQAGMPGNAVTGIQVSGNGGRTPNCDAENDAAGCCNTQQFDFAMRYTSIELGQGRAQRGVRIEGDANGPPSVCMVGASVEVGLGTAPESGSTSFALELAAGTMVLQNNSFSMTAPTGSCATVTPSLNSSTGTPLAHYLVNNRFFGSFGATNTGTVLNYVSNNLSTLFLVNNHLIGAGTVDVLGLRLVQLSNNPEVGLVQRNLVETRTGAVYGRDVTGEGRPRSAFNTAFGADAFVELDNGCTAPVDCPDGYPKHPGDCGDATCPACANPFLVAREDAEGQPRAWTAVCEGMTTWNPPAIGPDEL